MRRIRTLIPQATLRRTITWVTGVMCCSLITCYLSNEWGKQRERERYGGLTINEWIDRRFALFV